jgi:hypothetical protein
MKTDWKEKSELKIAQIYIKTKSAIKHKLNKNENNEKMG